MALEDLVELGKWITGTVAVAGCLGGVIGDQTKHPKAGWAWLAGAVGGVLWILLEVFAAPRVTPDA